MHPKLSARQILRSWHLPLLGCLACADAQSVGAPPTLSTTVPADQAAVSPEASASAVPVPPPPDTPWLAAVRLERYREAQQELDKLDEATKSKPEMRYLRARVASEIGAHKQVRELTDSLNLPMFADEIARLRAEAALEVGPYADAIAFYEKSGRPRDLVKAAKAAQRAGEPKRALTIADKALKESQRLKRPSDERQAHGVRVQILTEQGRGPEAASDLKWLATQFPASPEGREARKQIDAQKLSLTDKDKRQVIDALLEAGAGKDAVELVEKWGPSFSKAELAHRRAEALFKTRAYTKAADAFLAAAKLESGRTAEQLYYAARALARSKREDQAEKRYREVIKRYRKNSWAERASFQLGLLLSNQGRYTDASDAFTEYLAKFPDGTSRDDAEYALGVALLSSKQPAKAKTVLGKLAGRAKRTEWGVLRELEGVAALRAGQGEEAKQIFTQVATEQPLTWASSMARARLGKLGAPLPALATPAAFRASTPLDPALPPKAAQLVALGLDADAEAHLADNESTASAAYVGRETEALCLMYGKLSRAKRRYKVGAAAVSFESLMRAPSAADRWSWECLYPAPYAERVTLIQKERSITPGLIHSLMRQESAFDPEARSPVGAQGLMQLMPTTAEEAAKEAKLEGFKLDEIQAPELNLT
ncbi:MAG: transglycosylase SLT domain-containing protein, partial [Myxococcales bacterium]|nr:transglycosylase SLT domain-containing protein [Myxococcales bacterium]